MTSTRWLATRDPEPPAPLAARIRDIVRETGTGETPPALLAAAVSTVEGLLRSNASTRPAALDLLAADALVTYAFELAADAPARLDELAVESMRRLSAVASRP